MKRRAMLLKLAACLLALCLLPVCAPAEGAREDEWVSFVLVCNEGMSNTGGNVGNTMMVIAMQPFEGKIRLMMLTWDTFLHYEGYDVPQRIDMPYRNNGPEETMRVFNSNFNLDVGYFLSLNYLNLSSLIDSYGGVRVDVTRAERNALNGMVASKKKQIQDEADAGLLSEMALELLAKEYYLNEFGPDTLLNGLQAVGFGWLQYDSVYNCCLREVEVIANLFKSVSSRVESEIAFYTDRTGYPENVANRRPINLDHPTDEDLTVLRREVAPIFQMAYHNLPEEAIIGITQTLARVAFAASRQGVDIFDSLEYRIFPLENQDPYDIIAGAKGHLVDTAKNTEAMKQFLYGEAAGET